MILSASSFNVLVLDTLKSIMWLLSLDEVCFMLHYHWILCYAGMQVFLNSDMKWTLDTYKYNYVHGFSILMHLDTRRHLQVGTCSFGHSSVTLQIVG